MKPITESEALALLDDLGAPQRLLAHARHVAEAARALVAGCRGCGVTVDADFVVAGALLHDAGKCLHPEELDQPGAQHERAGEALLLAHGVSPAMARVCVTHAQWDQPEATLEALLVALADKLWKGKRVQALEERVIDTAAARVRKPRWDLFVDLDTCFEAVTADGPARLLASHPDGDVVRR
jgi:HD superfamily phosphodiesterase